MIVFDLACDAGHRFEGWFGSSADYEAQLARGLVACPQCESAAVAKAPMAPAVPSKGNAAPPPNPASSQGAVSNTPLPPEVAQAFRALVRAQAQALESSTWVGERFADKVRSMHYGEVAEAPIHGRATRDEALDLAAEGVAVVPILFPFAPPDERN